MRKIFKYLSDAEDLRNQVKLTRKHIKDLETEYEFLLTKEPHEVRYIINVKRHIDNLHENLDELYRKIDDEIN